MFYNKVIRVLIWLIASQALNLFALYQISIFIPPLDSDMIVKNYQNDNWMLAARISSAVCLIGLTTLSLILVRKMRTTSDIREK